MQMSKQLTLQLPATAKEVGKPELLSCRTTLSSCVSNLCHPQLSPFIQHPWVMVVGDRDFVSIGCEQK